MNEVELGKMVMCWLMAQYDDAVIYQEPPINGWRPDIVVKLADSALMFIELKVRYSGGAMMQAARWIDYANYKYLAVAGNVSASQYKNALVISREHSVGLIECGTETSLTIPCDYRMAIRRDQALGALVDDFKAVAPAGSCGIKKVAPVDVFKRRLFENTPTVDTRLAYVIERIHHHYIDNKRARNMAVRIHKRGGIPWAEMVFSRGEWWIKKRVVS